MNARPSKNIKIKIKHPWVILSRYNQRQKEESKTLTARLSVATSCNQLISLACHGLGLSILLTALFSFPRQTRNLDTGDISWACWIAGHLDFMAHPGDALSSMVFSFLGRLARCRWFTIVVLVSGCGGVFTLVSIGQIVSVYLIVMTQRSWFTLESFAARSHW